MDKPIIEELLIQWLSQKVSIPVSGQDPDDLPDRFIVVSREGGARESMVLDMASILIEVYDKNSKLNAGRLAEHIADMIPDFVAESNDITHSSVNSVTEFTDRKSTRLNSSHSE